MSMMGLPDLSQRRKSEEELIRGGWTRRFVGGPPRLQEMVELYKALGYEVWLEPQAPEEFRDECEDCTLALRLFRVVYTRKQELGREFDE
jgi:hypothetical protein